MFRVLSTWYLIFAFTAGPWLCCCTPGRLTEACRSVIVRLNLPILMETSGACCGGQHGPLPTSEFPKGEKYPSQAPPKPCPCHSPAKANLLTLAPKVESGPLTSRSVHQCCFCDSDRFDLTTHLPTLRSSNPSTTTFDVPGLLDLHDRLSLLHFWRC